MHTFVGVVEGHDVVYVDLPDWEQDQGDFPGWQVLARQAVVEQGLMTQEDAERASFLAGNRPPAPKSYFR